jgi:hypothetical protein
MKSFAFLWLLLYFGWLAGLANLGYTSGADETELFWVAAGLGCMPTAWAIKTLVTQGTKRFFAGCWLWVICICTGLLLAGFDVLTSFLVVTSPVTIIALCVYLKAIVEES